MSYYFEFDRAHRILRARIENTIGDDETIKFRTETTNLLSRIGPTACIVDLSDAEQYDISSARIGSLARSAPTESVSIPVIIVAPALHMFGASRMFQIISDEKRPWFRVVRSSDEAYKLLGELLR